MEKSTSDFSLKKGIQVDKHDSLSIFHRLNVLNQEIDYLNENSNFKTFILLHIYSSSDT